MQNLEDAPVLLATGIADVDSATSAATTFYEHLRVIDGNGGIAHPSPAAHLAHRDDVHRRSHIVISPPGIAPSPGTACS